MLTFFLAIRNLLLQKQRHSLIAIAVAIIFSLMTIATGALHGSLEAIKIKAGRYFSGNVSITGYTNKVPQIPNPVEVIDYIKKSQFPIRTISSRTAYYKDDAVLFFNGETIRQRKLIGIDFAVEGQEFKSLRFTEGSWESLLSENHKDDGILISASAAHLLGCRVGDDLTLYLTTDPGQYNTARLIVKGIFDETSLFGFVAYMRRTDLNRLLLREMNAATDIAVYAKEGVDVEHLTEKIRTGLEKQYNVFPPMSSRSARDALLITDENKSEMFSVLSQNAQLAEIKQLIDALHMLTYFILGIFVGIVMVGILNTYRVIIHERIKEIGTLRAIGMGSNQVRALFLMEAAILALASSFIGLIIGVLLFRLIAFVDFSFIPAAGMFMEAGHLRFSLDPNILALNVTIMVSAAVLAALGPSQRAARIQPAEALRSAA